MPDSPDSGNDLHHYLDLLLVSQLQNLSGRFCVDYKTPPFSNYRILSHGTIPAGNTVKSSGFA